MSRLICGNAETYAVKRAKDVLRQLKGLETLGEKQWEAEQVGAAPSLSKLMHATSVFVTHAALTGMYTKII